MSSDSVSAEFMQLFDSLPAEAQRSFVEKQLAPLLNIVPKEHSAPVIASASGMHKKFWGIPTLNLKAKKAEMRALLAELSRDSKRSSVKEQSNKEELLMEATNSLVEWLNDIWKAVYEYGTHFMLAHSCLLFACDILDNIANARAGCKCSFINLFIPIKIRRSCGKVVKSFKLTGAHNLDQVMLWIWRDLFVTILAKGTIRHREAIPDMLDDIQHLLGWKSLDRMLYGGKKSLYDDDDEDEYDEDENGMGTFIDEGSNDGSETCSEACSEAMNCPCGYHAAHWSAHVDEQRSDLKQLVHEALIAVFKVAPSLDIYLCLTELSDDDPEELEAEVMPILESISTYSSDNFAAALYIYAHENQVDTLVSLLNSHYHLLRPCDAPELQLATLFISHNPFFRPRSLKIVEAELLDTADAIHAALRSNFYRMDVDTNKADLAQILTLRHDTAARQSRVERWVNSVITPSLNTRHPMALAALMMGFPLPVNIDGDDDADDFGYLDIDPNDPDLEELREDYRPNLQGRFASWVKTSRGIKGSAGVFLMVYKKLLEKMPFLDAADVVEEMSTRLSDKPSKHYVCHGLEALHTFCQDQKARVTAINKKKKMKAPVSTSASKQEKTSLNTTPQAQNQHQTPAQGPSSSSSSSSVPPPPSTSAPPPSSSSAPPPPSPSAPPPPPSLVPLLSSSPPPTQLPFPFAAFVDTSQPPAFGFGGLADVD
ncbi:hypothetical protein BJ138DRAFT_1120150 [Hygrophoropsis aurantiaca]|uniref:Uncharacterized protein n=1 Tax=Hygrophoropsis aurantiaca TaxID=72124 RepID=A0ACB7ZS52_9AGAM|nr:hypothetical protein BJ138DRAFT_1120150 [Hygrophoropsis aurantiaca]